VLSAKLDHTIEFRDFGRLQMYRQLTPQVEAALKTLQMNPDDPAAAAVMGQWWAFRGMNQWAVESLEKAQAGGVAVSELMLGRCYWKLDRFADAKREFTSVLSHSQNQDEQAYLKLCIQVIDADAARPAPQKLPLILFSDGIKQPPYIWSGWMGDITGITVDPKCPTNPHTGKICMKCQHKGSDTFAGIAWQSPPNDWGDQPGGLNLKGATKLTFWARGEDGGEVVVFKLG
jgi:hypothetical protein